MTIVLTGGTGHIGGNLTRALVAAGRRVRLLVHEDTEAVSGLDVEIVKGDVRDPDSVQRALKGAEIVYHLAAKISIEPREDKLCQEINVGGTKNVVEACLKHGVRRLVHCSSVHAISQYPLETPVDEDGAPADASHDLHYDRSKAGGEKEVRAGIARGLDAVILNPAGVIGRFDYRPSRMGAVLIGMHDGTLPGLIQAGYDFVDVRDVVDGALAAETKGIVGRRYLLTGHRVTFSEMAALVHAIPGAARPSFASPMWLARFGAPFVEGWARVSGTRPIYTATSLKILRGNSRFVRRNSEADLGYTARPLEETITDAIDWFRENGRLKRAAPRSKNPG